jgi:hypothetical protein
MRRITAAFLKACLVAAFVAGCNLGTAADTPLSPTITPINGAVVSTTLGSPRVIAWNPNTRTLGWVQPSGLIPLETDLAERAVVQNCVTAPDGNSSIMHTGTMPVLYPLNGGSARKLGETLGLACTIQRRIQYSPDGARLGLMQYTSDVMQGNFVVGMLRVQNVVDGKTLIALNDVTSFEMYNDGVLYLQLFSGGGGRARTAALRWWDGKEDRAVESNILTLDDCQFVAGRAIRMGEKAYTLFGERCPNKGSSWRLMRTDMAGGNSQNIQSQESRGAYFLNAGTNDLWPLPTTNEILVAHPNGLAADVVNLLRVSVVDDTVQPVMTSVTIDQHPPSTPRRFVFSTDGKKLAFVKRDGNGAETLYLYQLDQPAEPPLVVAGGNRGDQIGAVAWAGDSQRLYYLDSGDANTLSVFALTGESKVIQRGTFQGLALNPDGTLIATSEQVRLDARDVRNHLVLIQTADGQKTTLVEGGRGELALTPLILR